MRCTLAQLGGALCAVNWRRQVCIDPMIHFELQAQFWTLKSCVAALRCSASTQSIQHVHLLSHKCCGRNTDAAIILRAMSCAADHTSSKNALRLVTSALCAPRKHGHVRAARSPPSNSFLIWQPEAACPGLCLAKRDCGSSRTAAGSLGCIWPSAAPTSHEIPDVLLYTHLATAAGAPQPGLAVILVGARNQLCCSSCQLKSKIITLPTEVHCQSKATRARPAAQPSCARPYPALCG
eukprot:359551-Chlamydomonas_euryale.AAC.4